MSPLNQEWLIIPIRTPAEYQLASWAIGRTLTTFEVAFSGKYIHSIPAMPRLFSSKLLIPADSLIIEEMDYQLTIAIRDDDDAVYFDPVVGDRLMHRIRQSIADQRIKRLFACRFVHYPSETLTSHANKPKFRLVS